MKLLFTLFGFLLISSIGFAGGSSSSGGSRSNQMMQVMKDDLVGNTIGGDSIVKDYIRSMGHDADGKVKFQYKPFDSEIIQSHRLNVNDISSKFMRAIEDSEISHQWEAVRVEPTTN